MAAAMTFTATQILDQIYASRERDLLRRISESHDLDFETLLNTFGTPISKSGVEMGIALENPVLSPPLVGGKKKTRRTNVPDCERCMARVWNGGKGGRCTRRGGKGPNSDLCGNHARCLSEKGELPQGRMDEDVPENMISSTNSSPVSPGEDPEKNGIVEGDKIDALVLDEALEQLVGVKKYDALDEITPGEDDSPGKKKKRGRPKGRKNTAKSTENDSLGSGLEDEILQEDEMKSCVSQDDIHACLKDYLMGSTLSEVSVTTAKKAIEKKLNINSKDYDRKWFKESFTILKSKLETSEFAEEESKEAEMEEGFEEQEENANDSDSEEVACQEISVCGVKYLLDPDTMKVYARESPNGFVGKYDGSEIDFDAEDSDAESDDEE